MRRQLVILGLLWGVPLLGAELKFWHSMSGEKGRLLQRIVEQFNTEIGNGQGSPVKAQFVGSYIEGLNKIRTSLLAGKGPHIAQVFEIGTRVMIDSGRTIPLTELAQGDAEFPWALLLPAIRRYYEVEGVVYSLPFATSNPILYYNQSLFSAAGVSPPKTFADLEAVAKKLTSAEQKIKGITWPLHSWFFEQFLAVQGWDLVGGGNGRKEPAQEALLTQEAALRFVVLWKRGIEQGWFSNVGRGWEPAEQNFLAGRAAMLITSTADVLEVQKKAPFPVGTSPLPGRDPARPGGTVVGGNSLWVFRRSAEENRAAYAFLKFMARKDIQRLWHTETGYFPIRKDVIDELEKEGFYRKFPAARTAIDQLLAASTQTTATQGALVGVFPQLREYIETALEETFAGTRTVEGALANAKKRSDRSLLRYYRTRRRSQ